ncbi:MULTISPECIES: NADPH-dependent FMN reductase [Streptomyces]|uniref:NADPH-dependent FMN reductase n=1 Tax=Streptomyces TaxID=1883 RepID=UPI0006EB84D2|nr:MULTISPECIES: NAD(P)H-dependent oxidoreductase [Streptomyces]
MTTTPDTTAAAPLRLAVVVGSNRDGRFGPTVADWFTALAEQHTGFTVDVIDVAALDLPDAHPAWGTEPTPAQAALAERVDAADAYVVVTPEYNHSFPAGLKHFIDLHRTEWEAKAVGFVSYGGTSGGLRAVEQLRLVFAELHCATVRDGVSFHGAWDHFGEGGRAHDKDGAPGAAKVMLDQLAWWAKALRTARAENPYR